MFSLPSQDIRLNITVSLWTVAETSTVILGFPRKPCSLPCSSSDSFTFIFDIKKDQFQSHAESTGRTTLFLRNTTQRFFFAETEKYILPNGGLMVIYYDKTITKQTNHPTELFLLQSVALTFLSLIPLQEGKIKQTSTKGVYLVLICSVPTS